MILVCPRNSSARSQSIFFERIVIFTLVLLLRLLMSWVNYKTELLRMHYHKLLGMSMSIQWLDMKLLKPSVLLQVLSTSDIWNFETLQNILALAGASALRHKLKSNSMHFGLVYKINLFLLQLIKSQWIEIKEFKA